MQQQIFGFAGVGRMGASMAPRLLAAGHAVHVFDISQDAIAAMEKLGAKRAASIAELADQAETIFLSLPNPEIVQSATLGKDGLLEGTTVKRVVATTSVRWRWAAMSRAVMFSSPFVALRLAP